MYIITILCSICIIRSIVYADPSDFFTTGAPRPRLEILSPENGQILDNGQLTIRLAIDGYELPSKFHDSSICVGLSSDAEYMDQCFDQTDDLVYNIHGLKAGISYMLRVVLFERGNAIAVSVRNFKVGGVLYMHDSTDELVTIQSAVQVAMKYQAIGMEKELEQAEIIYKSILSEDPHHADSLHLLGVVLYQKGDISNAIPYIERAIMTNDTDSFHNSLGECYRIIGDLAKAQTQFKRALVINPFFYSAIYNLGLVAQQTRNWEDAVRYYQDIISASITNHECVSKTLLLESKIRECDLQQAQGKTLESKECWEHAIVMFPDNDAVYNELGNVHARNGDYETAFDLYQRAVSLGSIVAELNAANMQELCGYIEESRLTLQNALHRALILHLPAYHILIRLATVVARIIPQQQELVAMRISTERDLDALLVADRITVDNAPPLSFGFSTGLYYAFHGYNNVLLKSKLYRVYTRLCPSLLTSYFLDRSQVYGDAVITSVCIDNHRNGDNSNSVYLQTSLCISSAATAATSHSVRIDEESPKDTDTGNRPIRIGLVSRYMVSTHVVGVLCSTFVAQLGKDYDIYSFFITNEISMEGVIIDDYITARIIQASIKAVFLPFNIADCARQIRNERLDVIIYPEIGIDPITYFLSFSKLAFVSCAWFGHADTTGIKSIDYYISGEVEVFSADKYYSEKLVRLLGPLGIRFEDDYFDIMQPAGGQFDVEAVLQTSQIHRDRIVASLGLPKSCHLYIIAHPLYTLHSNFDEVLSKILVQDNLGYIVIVDRSTDKPSWQHLFISRVAGKYSNTVKSRVLFIAPTTRKDELGFLMAANVLLDPFPASSSLLPSLHALALGIPVVTFPSDKKLSGRFTLGLYQLLGYGFATNNSTFTPASKVVSGSAKYTHTDGLIVSSVDEYIHSAMAIAFKPQLRLHHSSNILHRRHHLFEVDYASTNSWKSFLDGLRAK